MICVIVFQCSQTCGSGHKVREVSCVDTTSGREVKDSMCGAKSKPRWRRRCNDQPCPYLWIKGEWSKVGIPFTYLFIVTIDFKKIVFLFCNKNALSFAVLQKLWSRITDKESLVPPGVTRRLDSTQSFNIMLFKE